MYRCLAIGLSILAVVSPVRADQPPTVTASRASAWEYPGSSNSVSSDSGGLYNSVRTTTDDLATVVAHYEKKLGVKIAVDKPEASSVESLGGKQTAVLQDSLQPAEREKRSQQRDVTLLLASQNAKEYCLTVVISRGKGEKHTHIALMYVSK